MSSITSDDSITCEKIKCVCGSMISNNVQAIYIHEHGICHRYKTGIISKEQYDDYRESQKVKYRSEDFAERTALHREKMKKVMRQNNAQIFAKNRCETVYCDACKYDINKYYLNTNFIIIYNQNYNGRNMETNY